LEENLISKVSRGFVKGYQNVRVHPKVKLERRGDKARLPVRIPRLGRTREGEGHIIQKRRAGKSAAEKQFKKKRLGALRSETGGQRKETERSFDKQRKWRKKMKSALLRKAK